MTVPRYAYWRPDSEPTQEQINERLKEGWELYKEFGGFVETGRTFHYRPAIMRKRIN